MLREILNVRQNRGELRRRWFTSGSLDLVVWENEGGEPQGFQFCYDKGRAERALSWNSKYGYSHMAVDDGEGGGALRYKATPMLIAIQGLGWEHIAKLFAENAVNLPNDIAAFVGGKIAEYGAIHNNE